jgi:two-component system response regulator RegA
MEKDAFPQSIAHGQYDREALDKSLLVVDDDRVFCERLARGLSSRGFEARTEISVAEALRTVRTAPPAFVVVELRLRDGTGLDVVQTLKTTRPDARAVILTHYGALASAVRAMKVGAFDYLAKPATVDDVVAALMAGRLDAPPDQEHRMSAHRARWEYVQRVFEACDCNVTETARQLHMHRRSLQRILAKHAPK